MKLFLEFQRNSVSWNMELKVHLPLTFLILVSFHTSVHSEKPDAVNIGAVFTFDSVIGRVAKSAIEIAVSDINANPRILNGTHLKLIMEDASCDAFLGSIKAFQVLENDVVAIIGPQSSSVAHVISQIANGLHVPLLSYAATDPTLTALQFPFFLRTTHSDSHQMTAMADLIDFYGWKQVIAIFTDNDYGRNGVSVLGDKLAKKMARISYKIPLPVEFDLSYITEILNKSKHYGPRVYVLHIDPDPMLKVLSIAQKLNMLTIDYVWLATDWLSTSLDAFAQDNRTLLSILEGVVVLRPHIPHTTLNEVFSSRWRKMQQKGLVSALNVYGLYAYDTVWAVAYSIDKLLKEQINISFSVNSVLEETQTDKVPFGNLKVFSGGELLLNILRQSIFNGVAGQIKFDSDRNMVINGYEVLNVVRMTTHLVGYWSNDTGFSLSHPETLKEKHMNSSLTDQKLDHVTWPGGRTEKPRGFVLADNEKPLFIGIPKRTSFTEFVTEISDSHEVRGYCIDIFEEASKLVPYEVPFRYRPFGDGISNPGYDDLVKLVADEVFDAVVGDIAIVTNRTRIVDFTQPYVASGLVIVAPLEKKKLTKWVFLKPFTSQLWSVIGVSFIIIAVVIWILEHRVNDDFRGSPKKQLATMLLFSFTTLFKTNKEDTISTLGKMVMLVWLFLLLVITSSYTASLTSILTVQQLSSTITGIDSLIASGLPIGYQVGSFAFDYLSESLNVAKSRLVSLRSPEEYEKALKSGPKNGGVAAIVDELPYVELFLKERPDFGIVGHQYTRNGWGFVFQKGSPLAMDMSTAVLKLSENGKLQEIHDKWFCRTGSCPTSRRIHNDPNQLHLSSFWKLYFLCGVFSIVAFLIFVCRAVWQFVNFKKRQMEGSSPSSIPRRARCSEVILNFFDFIDEKEEAIRRYFNQQRNPQPQATERQCT